MRNTQYDGGLLTAVTNVNKRYVDLFKRAFKRTDSHLEALLVENAYTEVSGSPAVYHCVADDAHVFRRNHREARRLASGATSAADYMYFTNPFLRDAGEDLAKWSVPKDRATLGQLQVFTFEYDREPEFLWEQLEWGLPLKTPEKSAFGRLSADLAGRYADYDGITAVYSGNRSVHIHVRIKTDLYRYRHGNDLSADAVHDGHAKHWRALVPIVEQHLRPTPGVGPDNSLAVHGAFRRMPNAVRTVDKDNHPLGFPTGTKVPQVIVWQDRIQRREEPVDTLFLSPSRFASVEFSKSRSLRVGGTTPIARYPMTSEQLAHCCAEMRAHYAESELEFVDFDVTGDQWIAHFRNGPNDLHPSTIMGEDHDRPLVRGRDAELVTHLPNLPLPLGEMIREWCRAYHSEQPYDLDDLAAVRTKLSAHLPFWIDAFASFLLHAPEGLGKSTGIMRHIKLTAMTESMLCQPNMVALATYADAEIKAGEFNATAAGTKFVGVAWPSFRGLYEQCAGAVQTKILSYDDADEADMSLRAMIDATQPEVAAAMRDELARLWSMMDGKTPVLFTSHANAHLWKDNTYTRQMLSSCFFDDQFDPQASRKSTALNWLIHDEVSVETFVDLYSPREFSWLSALQRNSKAVWSGASGKRQRGEHARHLKSTGAVNAVDIFAATRALKAGLDAFAAIEVRNAYEYFKITDDVRDFECDGHVYHLLCRDWWRDGDRQVAERIVYLTTEAVPTLVAKKALEGLVPSLEYGDAPCDLAIRRPNFALGKDRVHLIAQKFTADKVPGMAQIHLAAGKTVIANNMGGSAGTISPMAARGRNDLAENEIVQYANHFPTALYGRLQALNTWLGREDVCRLAHADVINQTCGRNRGPRNRGATHEVYINNNLYRSLMACDTAVEELRYHLDVRMDKGAQREARRAGKPSKRK